MVNYFRRLLDINDRAAGPVYTADRAACTYTAMDYTYIVKCRDGTLYTGWTNDLEKRVHDHNCKKGAKYTRSRTPVELVYYEAFLTKSEAMKREYEIKQLSASEKWKMILG